MNSPTPTPLNVPLPLKIPMIRIKPLSADIITKRVTEPGEALTSDFVFTRFELGLGVGRRTRRGRGPELGLLETLCDSANVEVEVVGEEFADFGVFVVSLERPGGF
jgi:hypothetical protein